MPGPKYWQQRADYDLHGTLDTAAKSLKGEMTLRYTNNSPDTLRFIWFQVEQNAFKNNSLNSFVFPRRLALRRAQLRGRRRHRSVQSGDGRQEDARSKTRVDGTIMKVDLVAPLAPGQTATFDVAWHFNIPEHGADRMGRDGALYELAQWYPRVCVYDDLRGWNTEPYLGQGEFYLEYGDFNLDGHRAGRLHRRGDGRAAEPDGGADAGADLATRAGGEVGRRRSTSSPQEELKSGAARPKKTGHADLALQGAERPRRRLGRVARLHVGRVELEGAHGVRATIARARSRRGRTPPTCRACRFRNTRSAGSTYPVSADHRRRGTDQRHGIPDGRDGERRAPTSTTCTTS